MTSALVRKCNVETCKTKFVKSDGCNSMHCKSIAPFDLLLFPCPVLTMRAQVRNAVTINGKSCLKTLLSRVTTNVSIAMFAERPLPMATATSRKESVQLMMDLAVSKLFTKPT